LRNQNPFTERQIKLLNAVQDKIREINDPHPEVIRNESYEFFIQATKQFGKIPKIKFKPNCTQIKSELIIKADLRDYERQQEIAAIRKRYGIKQGRNREANLFESEWNNIMLKCKKATATLATINQLFANPRQIVSDPIALMQEIVLDEYGGQIKAKKGTIHCRNEDDKPDETHENKKMRGYGEELAKIG